MKHLKKCIRNESQGTPGVLLAFFLVCMLSDTLAQPTIPQDAQGGESNARRSEVNSGRELFRTNCSPCHNIHREIAGPMLASIPKKRTEAWLLNFITNSQQVILDGDNDAMLLFENYNRMVMPSFENISEKDIRNMLAYIEEESIRPKERIGDFLSESEEAIGAWELSGKALFTQQCSTCHFIAKEGYGPALGSVSKRRSDSWLLAFIKDSQSVIRSGDSYANHLYEQFDKKEMVQMRFLSDDDIHEILDYIKYASASPTKEAGVNVRRMPVPLYKGDASGLTGGLNEDKGRFRIFIIIAIIGSTIIFGYIMKRIFGYLK